MILSKEIETTNTISDNITGNESGAAPADAGRDGQQDGQMDGQHDENSAGKKDTTVYILGTVAVVLLCVVSFLLGRISAPRTVAKQTEVNGSAAGTSTGGEESLPSGKISPSTLESESSAVESKAPAEEAALSIPAAYEVVMNTDWNFESGSLTSSNAYVENSRENKNSVFFTLRLDDYPDETIYTSEVLSVGEVLTDIRIDKKLPDGDYHGMVTYHILGDSLNREGTVEMEVTLHVG